MRVSVRFHHGERDTSVVGLKGSFHKEKFFQFCFFVFQALLTRIAQSPDGAKALLSAGVMSRLSECRFIDLRPSGHESHFGKHHHSSLTDRMVASLSSSGDTFVPSVMERYQQLLIPALRMSLSILTSLGQQHHEASLQVIILRSSGLFVLG